MIEKPLVTRSARFECDPSIPNDCIDSLREELEKQGFVVEIGARDRGLQAAVEWALPPLTTLILSGAGAVGALTAKKYFDGFLEEIGVKTLGSQSAKLLKAIFLAGVQSDKAHYNLQTKKREPSFNLQETPDDNLTKKEEGAQSDERGEPQLTLYGKPAPFSVCFNFGGNDADNPPWKVTFIFTRDLDDAFDDALAAIPNCLSLISAYRSHAWITFKTKLSNPHKYYGGRSLTELNLFALADQIMTIDRATCGVYLFDSSVSMWIQVSSASELMMIGELLQSFLDAARRT